MPLRKRIGVKNKLESAQILGSFSLAGSLSSGTMPAVLIGCLPFEASSFGFLEFPVKNNSIKTRKAESSLFGNLIV